MNSLTIPPSINWYLPNIIVCTPDNTVIYGSRSDIVIIYNEKNEPDRPATVKVLSRVHFQKIISVGINKNWGQPNKYLVTVSEDKVIKLWNLDTFERKLVNVSFVKQNSALVGATFAGNDRIVCVTEDGAISIWNIVLNEETQLRNDLFGKAGVTSFSICPHASYLGAFGMKNGLIFVADLRRTGKVLYRLRGHDKSIVSLVWCPVPFNVFPEKPNNYVKFGKNEEKIEEECVEQKESENVETLVEEAKETVEESAKKPQKVNPWVNLTHADDDEQPNVEPEEIVNKPSNVDDFLTECRRLKEQILNIRSDLEENGEECTPETVSEEETKETEPETVILEETKPNSPPEEETRTILPKSEPEAPRKEFLLASSSREPKIYIWRAGSDGRMQTFLLLPNKNNPRKGKPLPDHIWTSLCWPNPHTLFVSSKTGELLKCHLPRRKGTDKQFVTIHNNHHPKLLFNIVAPQIPYTETDNIPDDLVENVWSAGQDRLLINTNIQTTTNETLSYYTTIGAGVTVLQASPLDPTRLAIGTTDGIVHMWDLSKPHTNCIKMQHFTQKIKSKVCCLVWHPTHEMSLAFGTLEGRIGVLDVSNPSKSPVLMPNYFKDTIYHLEFGPLNGDSSDLGLYAVSEGKLAVFNSQKTDVVPSFVDIPDGLTVYLFTWHPNRKYLLVNTKTGSIMIFSNELKWICTQYVQQKCFKFVWHPDAYNLNGDSVFKDRFAVAVNNDVLIYDLKVDEEGKVSVESLCKLENGHCEHVNSVAWCPFDSNRIVSAGDDGIAHVWDVETQCILSTYVNPGYDCINTVLWSSVSEDYIIVGSKNHLVNVYNVNENKACESYENLVVNRTKAMKKINNECLYGTEKETKVVEKKVKPMKVCLLPTFYGVGQEKDPIGDMKALLAWKKTGDGGITNGKFGIFNVFGSSEDMMKLLDFNENAHKSKGKHNYSGHISLFKGDLNNFIKEAIEEKRVTPWIISVAPMASHNLWLSACETYADQLMEETHVDPLQVVSYLLITHKLDRALEYLCEKELFREALALSKARQCDSDVINGIITKWAKHLVFTGMFELAAQCFIYLGEFEQAASVLFRRTDLNVLEFATEVALECKNEELYKAIKFRYESFKEAEDKENIGEEKVEVAADDEKNEDE